MSIAMLPIENKSTLAKVPASELKVQAFSDTTERLQQFIQTCWQSAYQGKMSFPIWTSEYLDWQVPQVSASESRRLAVFDGDKPVGVLLGSPYNFCHKAEVFSGSHWSWLSVDPEYYGRGIAKLLDEKRMEIECNLNSELVVSYRFIGSKHSLAERPSRKFPLKDFNRKIGFWARPLDAKKLSQWNLNRLEGFSSRLVSPLLSKTTPLKTNANIRKFEESDLTRCLEILDQRQDSFAISIAWDEDSLRRQLLGSELSQTVVAEKNGIVEGFLNFHILKFHGRTQEPVGIIDILADDNLPSSLCRSMILTALDEMKQQNAILALKLKSSDSNAFPLVRSGFIPRLPDSSLVFQWSQHRRNVNPKEGVHVLWR